MAAQSGGSTLPDLTAVPLADGRGDNHPEEIRQTGGSPVRGRGWKQLSYEVYRRYGFTPARIEVEEHHVKVYAGKNTDEIVRAPYLESLLRGSFVAPSLEVTVMNAKYVNAVPLYRQEQGFERYGLHISRQIMANWMIQCADRYLAVLYDYLHETIYHVLQACET